jgi:hypothetical protein
MGFACDEGDGAAHLDLPEGAYLIFASGWTADGAVALADAWIGGTSIEGADIYSITSDSTLAVTPSLSVAAAVITTQARYLLAGDGAPSYVDATGGCVAAYDAGGSLAGSACATSGSSTAVLHTRPGAFTLFFYGYGIDDSGTVVDLSPGWFGVPSGDDAESVGYGSDAGEVSTAIDEPASVRIALVRTASMTGQFSSTYLNAAQPRDGWVDVIDAETRATVATAAISSERIFRLYGLTADRSVYLFAHDMTGIPDQYVTSGGASTSIEFYEPVLVGSGPKSYKPVALPSAVVKGTIPYIFDFDTTFICVNLYQSHGSSFTEAPQPDWAFLDQQCGYAGDSFVFATLPGVHVIGYSDGNGHTNFTAHVLYPRGPNNTGQRAIDAWSPESFAWGDDVPIVITQLPWLDGTQEVSLRAWGWTGDLGSYYGSVTFHDGWGVIWLPTDQSNEPLGDLIYVVHTASGASSPQRTVHAVERVVTVVEPRSAPAGTAVPLNVAVEPASSGTARVWYRTPGGNWKASSNSFPITDGAGSTTVTTPSQALEYRIDYRGSVSGSVTLSPIVPIVTVAGSFARDVAPGTKESLTVTVDPASSGTARVWFRAPGGTWSPSSNTFAIADGAGSTSVTAPSMALEYRIEFGGGVSDAVTLSPVLPDVSLTAPSGAVPGSKALLEASVDPASSGTARVWFKAPGGVWTASPNTFAVADGFGSTRVTVQSSLFEYRVEFAGAASNTVGIAPQVPVVSLTGPVETVGPAGVSKVFEVSVSPASSGTAWVNYRLPGGDWKRSSNSFAITAGFGSTQVTSPSRMIDYRIEFAGYVSDAVTLTPAVVQIAGDAELAKVPGTKTTLDVSVDPSASGTAWVYYRLPGGNWSRSSNSFAVTAGAGSTQVTSPSRTVEYRVELAGVVSDAVSISPVAPTVTLSVAQYRDIGQQSDIGLVVDPVANGVATVWYQAPGADWKVSSNTFTVADGVGSTSVTTQPVAFGYKIVFAGTHSNTITIGGTPD